MCESPGAGVGGYCRHNSKPTPHLFAHIVPSTTKLRLRMSCASAIMAVTTAASIQTLISHPPPTALRVAPAAGLVHDASCAHFCGRRSNPPARRHDVSRPGFRLSTCAITCTHPASTTVPLHARKRSSVAHSAPLSSYKGASGAHTRVRRGSRAHTPQPAFRCVAQQRGSCITLL